MNRRCPKCANAITAEPTAAGVVVCPSCQAKLKVRPAAATPIPAIPVKPLVAKPIAVAVSVPDDDPPELRPRRKKKRRRNLASKPVTWVNGSLVLLVLLMVFGAVMRATNSTESSMRRMNERQAERDRERAEARSNVPFLAPSKPITYVPPDSFPALATANLLEGGFRLHTASLYRKSERTDVRIYLPPNKAADGTLPTILIAPAGSNCLCGKALENGDTAEHLPYAKEGFAVVAFSLSGPMPDEANELKMFNAFQAYLKADAGLHDAKSAIDFALARVPEIDPKRLYAAGHSSAGTFALMLAAREPRIKGVIAYAAPSDLETSFGPVLNQLRMLPNFDTVLAKTDPKRNEQSITCPVFLFHSPDDDIVPISQSEAFERRLKSAGKDVALVRGMRGGHYDSMLRDGIPAAIGWLKNKAGLGL